MRASDLLFVPSHYSSSVPAEVQVLAVILTFWFWLTPILVTEQQFPPWARFLVVANPLVYAVRAYRSVLLTSRLPDPQDLAIAAVYGCAAFILGGLFFRYMKPGFADVL